MTYKWEAIAQDLTEERDRLLIELDMARKHILDSTHYGHALYCSAVRGPEGENWYEHERCDCSRRAALKSEKQ